MTRPRLMPVAATAGAVTAPAVAADLDVPLPPPDAGEAVDTLARTLWGEARGEPVRAIEALAALVVNRVRLARARGGWWWGDSIAAVCRKPRQFASWDTQAAMLSTVTDRDPVFATCIRVARRAAAGVLQDPTGGATHVHRVGTHPSWADGLVPVAEIGSLLFYAVPE